MKVVLVGNTTPPDTLGGLGRYVRELATALARQGVDTTLLVKRVIADTPRVERAPDGVRIIRYDVPSKRNPLFGAAYPLLTARGVLGPLRFAGRDADIILHAHFPVTALPIALARMPYLYTFHAPVWRELLDERQGTYALPRAVQRPAVATLRAAERLVVARADRTVALSAFMRGELAQLSAAAGASCELLPGGVDTGRFSVDPSVARAADGAPQLFTARRLTPRTGVDRLVEAMPGIVRDHPRVRLAIAGVGEMDGMLRERAESLGMADRIRFLGRVSEDELVGWYRSSTLVVMPTLSLEGFGLTTAEALACGTPVVGTPVGATPELLAPLDPALIAPDNTPASLAATVSRALGDPVALRAVAARSRAQVEPTMGWDAIAARYIALYAQARPYR